MTCRRAAPPIDLARGAIAISVLAAVLLVTVLAVGTPGGAAVTTETVGDYVVRVDSSNPAAGATIVAYNGTAVAPVIPPEITVGETTYTVTAIGEESFGNKGLTSVVIPGAVHTIEAKAFWGNKLAAVTIPDSVVTIGDLAFFDNVLTEVVLGASVDAIGSSSFEHYDWDDDHLLALTVTFTGPPPSTFHPVAGYDGSFAEPDDVLVSYPQRYDADVYSGGYTRPDWQGYPTQGVVAVDFDLKHPSGFMASARVPLGFTFEPPAAPTRTGWTFSGWYTDPELTLPYDPDVALTGDITLYASWDTAPLVLQVTVDGITYEADVHDPDATATVVDFDSSRSEVEILAEVEIDGITFAVTTIGSNSFDGAGLTKVVIPDSVTTIEGWAFTSYDADSGINELGDLVIPDSVVTIGPYAFQGTALTSLTLGSGLREIEEGAFLGTSLHQLTLPDSLEVIGENAFLDNALTELVIPDGVTTIGRYAFYVNALEHLVLGQSLISIGEGAFASNALTEIVIPDSVSEIGDVAFHSNPLTRVVIGTGVIAIGEAAFGHSDCQQCRAILPLDVFFTGPPPATFSDADAHGDGSFSSPEGVLIHYPWAFDAHNHPDGFTSPAWRGYASVGTVTVTFEMNGHGDPIDPQLIPHGDTAAAPSDPDVDGWELLGWYQDEELTELFDFSTPVTADLTLYAAWQEVDEGDDTDPPETNPDETPDGTPDETPDQTPDGTPDGTDPTSPGNGGGTLPIDGALARTGILLIGLMALGSGLAAAGSGTVAGARRRQRR